MGAVTLSICIPTFNFGAFIGETLESIFRQSLAGVEIIVLDSASTDNTAAVIDAFATRFSNLRYIRADKREGIDRDLARVVAEAAGRYVWLFSADDVMRPNAVAHAVQAFPTGADVLLCSHSNCDKGMRYLWDHPVMAARAGDMFDLGDIAQRHEYFGRAITTEAFFSFMSGMIVKAETWRSVPLNEKFVGSCWAHVARLFELIKERGLKVCYIGGPLLDKRGDNDSFAGDGVVARWRLGIVGMTEIAADIFGKGSVEAMHVNRVLQNEFPSLSLLALHRVTRSAGRHDELPRLDELAHVLYAPGIPGSWAKRFAYRVHARIPAPILVAAVKLLEWTGAKNVLKRMLRSRILPDEPAFRSQDALKALE
ncbi:MAG: glycosyltransferase family 2 protein [Hyphomicrobiaceae bacterium]|nr:MAG: glycosyltransferase family 2 protein [Hyphomicrobiaceae bacterium]